MTVKTNIKVQEINSKDNLFAKTKLTEIKKRPKPIQNQEKKVARRKGKIAQQTKSFYTKGNIATVENKNWPNPNTEPNWKSQKTPDLKWTSRNFTDTMTTKMKGKMRNLLLKKAMKTIGIDQAHNREDKLIRDHGIYGHRWPKLKKFRNMNKNATQLLIINNCLVIIYSVSKEPKIYFSQMITQTTNTRRNEKP